MARTPDETRDASRGSGEPGSGVALVPELAAGATIAMRYRLVRSIARGGMGEVYEAEDLELGTRIAIKMIRAELIGDPAANGRLKQEILAARRITHPNVVRLFDVGIHVLEDQREVAFITMELLAGDTLAALLQAGALSPERALPLIHEMAAGLEAAHAAGIVHRDFKASNVIVVDGHAIVTDFGLALATDRVPSGTTSTDFVGTPAYMAPEQVTRSRAIGPAADIYALGVVIFEMVTGVWPFVRDTALATAAARIEAPAPAARSLAPALPPVWDRTIARCLERDPDARFARPKDVVAALVGRDRPRRRGVLAVGAAIVVAGAALAIGWRSGGSAAACAAPSLPDLFVDSAAPAGGTGSRACPLRTISAAVAIDAKVRTIHVAAGTYDRAHGEQFPLVLRGEVALIGAGPDRTSIVGTGSFDPTAQGGSMKHRASWQATIVTGDVTAPIRIEALAMSAGVEHTHSDMVGIACTRGRADRPNTTLRQLVLGPAYAVDVVVATETTPVATGCNLEVSDSRFQEGLTGIWELGCGAGEGHVPVGLHVRSSTFEAFHASPVYPGMGIAVWDCARDVEIVDNHFARSDAGISIVRHPGEDPPLHAAIRGNRFLDLTHFGVQLARELSAELRGNAFFNVGGVGELLGRSPALWILADEGTVPDVVARDNRFYNNDLAVEVTGSAPLPAKAHFDFGRPDDPGRNVFRCNAAPTGATVSGFDIAVRPDGGGARLDLAGNRWDHVPPTRTRAATGNGIDVLVAGHLVVDTSAPTLEASRCERAP